MGDKEKYFKRLSNVEIRQTRSEAKDTYKAVKRELDKKDDKRDFMEDARKILSGSSPPNDPYAAAIARELMKVNHGDYLVRGAQLYETIGRGKRATGKLVRGLERPDKRIHSLC